MNTVILVVLILYYGELKINKIEIECGAERAKNAPTVPNL